MSITTRDAAGVLDTPLALRSGATIKNRLVKAAMSEQLASVTGAPTQTLERLYARWARGGAGMLITGNVMIDRRSIGEARNVVVEDERDLPALRRWAAAAKAGGATAIVQINHPGRQSFIGLSSRVVAPSAVASHHPGAAKPRALTGEEILELIARFAETAGSSSKRASTASSCTVPTATSSPSSSRRRPISATTNGAATPSVGGGSCSRSRARSASRSGPTRSSRSS